ncbi:MAG: dihydrolipoamide acetyltransferase family protein [Actinomycetota bacterium]
MDVVTLPRLGVTMTSATVVSWEKREGDRVEKSEPLVVVESEKATIDIESPYSGILRKILAEEEEEVQVGQPLAIIAGADEEIDPEEVERRWRAEVGQPVRTEATVEEKKPPKPAEARPGGIRAAPRTKRLAEELGVDLAAVEGTGPEGVITEKDVRASSSGPRIRARVRLNQVRKSMASRMLDSWHNIPQFTQMVSVNADRLIKTREEIEDVSLNDLIIKAVAGAVAGNLEINSRFQGETVIIYEDVNISVAMATDQGLLVPVLRNADKKDVRRISTEIKQLQEKAANRQLTAEDLTGGTITVSNLGYYGVETGTAVINPPQSCMVFVGSLKRVPVVDQGDEIVIASMMELSIAYDHRFIDGVTASRFTTGLKEEIENMEAGRMFEV